ncbi:uncharacterized protein LOC122543991 [Chiloscyllium plagiosum]|uniref:uncharacterized protein LOC122543991 n=1 Tax=Chiloscyllium plagiosum TaxID=36176 RepID=UPI001CB86F23|nr:uncharacterized protein LOC122543991 [Chiloscyllium plagiosum]
MQALNDNLTNITHTPGINSHAIFFSRAISYSPPSRLTGQPTNLRPARAHKERLAGAVKKDGGSAHALEAFGRETTGTRESCFEIPLAAREPLPPPTSKEHGDRSPAVAAAGQWISNNQTYYFYKVIEKLLLQLSLRVVQVDLGTADLNEKFISSDFRLTFEVKIQFYVKVNGNLSTHIFKSEKLDQFCSNGHTVLSDSTHYIKNFECAADSHCYRLHPVAGKLFPLSIPNKLAEEGLCGVLEILSIAAICPCLKNYPNKPAGVSNVSVSLTERMYITCGCKWKISFLLEFAHLVTCFHRVLYEDSYRGGYE